MKHGSVIQNGADAIEGRATVLGPRREPEKPAVVTG